MGGGGAAGPEDPGVGPKGWLSGRVSAAELAPPAGGPRHAHVGCVEPRMRTPPPAQTRGASTALSNKSLLRIPGLVVVVSQLEGGTNIVGNHRKITVSVSLADTGGRKSQPWHWPVSVHLHLSRGAGAGAVGPGGAHHRILGRGCGLHAGSSDSRKSRSTSAAAASQPHFLPLMRLSLWKHYRAQM